MTTALFILTGLAGFALTFWCGMRFGIEVQLSHDVDRVQRILHRLPENMRTAYALAAEVVRAIDQEDSQWAS